MKTWKYGLALMLGLSVCGLAQAQQPNPENVPQRGIQVPEAIDQLITKGEYAKAVTEFDSFLAKSKNKPCDVLNVSYSFYARLALTDAPEAMDYQTKATSYLNQYLSTCGNTADACMLQYWQSGGMVEDAVKWMTKAIEAEPDYAEPYRVRGDALWRTGQMQEACVDFKKGAELKDGFCQEVYNTRCKELETMQQEMEAQNK